MFYKGQKKNPIKPYLNHEKEKSNSFLVLYVCKIPRSFVLKVIVITEVKQD